MRVAMKTMTSTEARQSFSSVISIAENEPVTISKKNKEIAVVVSSKRYHELKRLEDILYVTPQDFDIDKDIIECKPMVKYKEKGKDSYYYFNNKNSECKTEGLNRKFKITRSENRKGAEVSSTVSESDSKNKIFCNWPV